MIVPNKVISFSESIIGKMPIILRFIINEDYKIKDLFLVTKEYFNEIDEFILALDVLYILDAIDIKEGVITYVKKNK